MSSAASQEPSARAPSRAGPKRPARSGPTPGRAAKSSRSAGGSAAGPSPERSRIDELLAASDGGFGAYLFLDHDWAAPGAKLRSYELFAEQVMPRFQGQLDARAGSHDWLTGSAGEFVNRAVQAIAKATEDHAAERAARA